MREKILFLNLPCSFSTGWGQQENRLHVSLHAGGKTNSVAVSQNTGIQILCTILHQNFSQIEMSKY